TPAAGLGAPAGLAVGSGCGFGDAAYVSDALSGTILSVDALGRVTPFAAGFAFTPGGADGALAFSRDGHTLYVADGLLGVVAIGAGSAPPGAAAPVILPNGFAASIAGPGLYAEDLAAAPGAPYGEAIYAAAGGTVAALDPMTGQASTLALDPNAAVRALG